jgi:hypothetical protein
MLSYHNDENLKKMVVLEMKKHQEQDQFIKGSYSEDDEGIFKGCAVGCTIDSINKVLGRSYSTSSHSIFEKTIGVPEWLARLQDNLFENLPEDESSQFAVDFLSSIPVGVNLEPVKWRFCAFVLKECIERIRNDDNLEEKLKKEVVTSIQGVLSIHESAITSGTFDTETARAAGAAAEAAAWAAAGTAWAARAARAARAAAGTAGSAEAAARAAWAARAARAAAGTAGSAWAAAEAAAGAAGAAWAAAEAAAGAAAYKRYAEELIRILKEKI